MVKIEASILSADLTRLGDQVKAVEEGGADGIQIDIMDGRFVPNITFGANIVRAIRDLVKFTLDVHLMIFEPERHLSAFADAGADRIIVHQEACGHLHRILNQIRSLNVEAGVSINPGTSLNVLEEVFDSVDIIQIMTVDPGWGGQVFLRGQLDKIKRLKEMLNKKGIEKPIAVDGGIDTETAPLVVEAGASVLIAGSNIFNKKSTPAENIAALRNSCKSL